MKTPLKQSLATALRAIEAEHLTRYHNDARNYTGPKSVGPEEGAEMIAQACAPFLLDWRRLLDEVPPLGQSILIAARTGVPGEEGGPVVGEASLERLPSRQAFFWASGTEAACVFAWAPLPAAPSLETIGSPLAR